MIIKTQKILAVNILLLFFTVSAIESLAKSNSIPTNVPKTSIQKELEIPKNILNRRRQQVDQKIRTSADTVINSLQKNEDIILIDVRRAEDFQSTRIANSINMPLHFIKTKPYLKNRRIIIVSRGYDSSRLEQESERLKDAGFTNVSILKDGLTGWLHAGGELAGDPFAIKKIPFVSPAHYFRERHLDNQVVINAGGPKYSQDKNILPDAVLVSHSVQSDLFVEIIGNIITQEEKKGRNTTLIVNDDGDYGEIQQRFKEAGIKGVFYLKGGLRGYKAFLHRQAALRQPNEIQAKQSVCSTCP